MAKKKKIDTKKNDDSLDPKTEEGDEKAHAPLGDDVLEAFEDETPTGLEEETLLAEEEDDELGDLDFKTSDEW